MSTLDDQIKVWKFLRIFENLNSRFRAEMKILVIWPVDFSAAGEIFENFVRTLSKKSSIFSAAGENFENFRGRRPKKCTFLSNPLIKFIPIPHFVRGGGENLPGYGPGIVLASKIVKIFDMSTAPRAFVSGSSGIRVCRRGQVVVRGRGYEYDY